MLQHPRGDVSRNAHDGLIGSLRLGQFRNRGMPEIMETDGWQTGGLASIASRGAPRLDWTARINLAVIAVRGINAGILASGEHVMLRLTLRKVIGPSLPRLLWRQRSGAEITIVTEEVAYCDGSECGSAMPNENGELELLSPHWHMI